MTKPYYYDIDLSFEQHPTTGDIMRINDYQSVQESMRNILLSDPFTKPFAPEYGVGIKRYLFEITTPGYAIALKKEIRTQLSIWEPRAVIEDIRVGVTEEEYAAVVEIDYYVVGITQTETFRLHLERIR